MRLGRVDTLPSLTTLVGGGVCVCAISPVKASVTTLG